MSIFRKSLTATIGLQDLYVVPSGMETSIISIIVSELNGIDKTTILKIYDKFNIEKTTLQIFTKGNETKSFDSKIFLESGDIIKSKTTEGTTSIIISGAEDIVINQNIHSNFEYRGIYDEQQTYIKDNVVRLYGNLYIAKQQVPSFNPPPSTLWELFLEKSIDIEPGTISLFSFNQIPNGYLKCNGAELSRNIYDNLFNRIGTIYGDGDSSTTFNIPDLRGMFVRGYDDERNIDEERLFGSYQEDAMRHITGHARGNYLSSSPNSVGGAMAQSGIQQTNNRYAYHNGIYWGAKIEFDNSLVTPVSTENRPKNIAMLYCIKY